jgi:hypothetical protein
MDILVAIVIAPAVTFLVVAVALGARNPIRWAAWGAICGPVAFACMIAASERHPQQAAWQQAPIYPPTEERPAQKPTAFADLIPPQAAKDVSPGLY